MVYCEFCYIFRSPLLVDMDKLHLLDMGRLPLDKLLVDMDNLLVVMDRVLLVDMGKLPQVDMDNLPQLDMVNLPQVDMDNRLPQVLKISSTFDIPHNCKHLHFQSLAKLVPQIVCFLKKWFFKGYPF